MRRSKPIAGTILRASGGLAALIGVAGMTVNLAQAEPIKIGVVTVAAFAPVFIAQEKGYFAAEGIPAEIIPFDAAQPVAVGVTAGSIDFGVSAATAGLYNLAGQGALQIIGAAAAEHPGFHNQAMLASKRADAAGLKLVKQLPGHSFAVTGVGAPPVYVLGRISEKYGFDLKSIELHSLQSIPNVITSVVGGTSDATFSALNGKTVSFIERGDLKLMGWVGDEAPWQFGLTYTSTKAANDRHDTVAKFVRAFAKASSDYHNAFTAPDGTQKNGPAAPEMLAIIAKYTHQSAEDAARDIPYIDADARLDVNDVLHQVKWYQSRALVKADIDATKFIDKRYVIALP
jgi:NitT/TauT family transport system substrate-binding protein